MPKPRDDNDRARAGERLDPMDDMEEVPPPEEGETKSPAPEEELDELAPSRARLYGLDALEQDRQRSLLSLASLPLSYGWGEPLNRLLGGGLGPGDLIALGAASAGAGKTAFVTQLVDGLSLRTAQLAREPKEEPLTPVLLLSELSPEALSRRSLAWLTEESAKLFRAGRTAEKSKGRNIVDEAYKKAREFLSSPHGTLFQIQSWQRQVQAGALLSRLREEGRANGTAIVAKIRTLVGAWTEKLSREYPGRELWPVLVVDPIQRWQEHNRNEVEALNELCEALDTATDEEGWITLVTSDTNKDSAKGESRGEAMEQGAALFRGSYKLLHCADVACYLDRVEGDPRDPLKYVPLKLFKNRYGPSFGKVYFAWDTPTGRFRPLSEEEQGRYEIEKQRAAEAAQAKRLAEKEMQRQAVKEKVNGKTGEDTRANGGNDIPGGLL